MKNTSIFVNLDRIESIAIVGFRAAKKYYILQEEIADRSFFGLLKTVTTPGLYQINIFDYERDRFPVCGPTESEINEWVKEHNEKWGKSDKLVYRDGSIYHIPYVKINFAGKPIFEYFDTIEQAKAFVERIVAQNPRIIQITEID